MFTDTNIRRLILGLAIFGLLVSLYLVYIKFNPTSSLCLAAGGCEAVNTSRYSEVAGIPIAVFGALTYIALVGLVLLEPRLAVLGEWGPVIEFGIALAGTLYSAYLTYLEIAVIHQICPYCVASAVAITLICIAAGIRLRRYFE